MIGKGIYEFEIEGKKIGFKFGMYAAGITEREAKCNILELFENIHNKKDSSLSLLYYFYGAAVAYNLSKKNDQLLTLDDVSDYIEMIGLEAAMNVFKESITGYIPKNINAPETT